VRHGLNVLNFWDQLGHPRVIQDIARRAEAAGWDGLFTWDTALAHWETTPTDMYDPFVLLAGAACVTDRLLLGTNVTPVPRRRPYVLANQVATLDALSGGRAVLGVGLGGDPKELELLGEVVDARERAAMLDTGLDVIRARWSGAIWVGGDSKPARRRAGRFQGWTTGLITDAAGTRGVTPEAFEAKVRYVLEQRTGGGPFDVLVEGYSQPGDEAMVAEYADAGATWWCDSINGFRAPIPDLLARIDAGPPR
jgi:alkanesulfonate monooxygenase SsuD/methylene tetrahydromethanopterin reductase-like flavin-dependent oxidoreductase (luciferase family)